MPRVDRLAVTVSLVMMGLALSVIIALPAQQLSMRVLGSSLSVNFSGVSQFGVVVIAVACVGVDALMRTHPLVHARSLAYTATFWVLPCVVTLASMLVLGDLSWWGYQVVLIGLTGVALGLVMVAQYRSIDAHDPRHRLARLALNGAVYVAALVVFVSLYGSRQRSIVSATGILIASGLLAIELYRSSPQASLRQVWLFATLTALLMGELTWALNYSSVDARIGGAFLLLVFYLLSGLVQQHLWQRLTRHAWIEYAVVCAVAMLALGSFSRFAGG
ncbi:MAG: DUF5656 family protein [Anaerolineae bacterium]